MEGFNKKFKDFPDYILKITYQIWEEKDVESIMQEYCRVRLELYQKRKAYQLHELEESIKIISAKCRFILDIIDEQITIQKRTKDNIIQQLTDKDYPLMNDSYDYLLRLPIYTLSQEEIDKLMKEKGDLDYQYTCLQKTTIKELWILDLKLFEKFYKKFLNK
mgnify:CR=1 FL=1